MGFFRFRKSFRIAPGVRMNVSKSGSSFTLGGRGASVNVGGQRPRATVGLPGTGISYSESLSEGGGAAAPGSTSSGGRRAWALAALLGVIALVVVLSL